MNMSVVNGTDFCWVDTLFHLRLVRGDTPEDDEEELAVVPVPTDLLSPVRSDMIVASEVLIFFVSIISIIMEIMIWMNCEPLFFFVDGLDDIRSMIIILSN